MAMTPRMAQMWLDAQREEGVDVDAKKMESIEAGITALAKQIKIKPQDLEKPIMRKITFSKNCPFCCRILRDDALYCDHCGQCIG